jgi:hypothetical protein
VELVLVDGAGAGGGLTVSLAILGAENGEELFRTAQPLPTAQKGGSWRDGVLRLKLASLPRTGYAVHLARLRLNGTFVAACLADWIAGNDRWRKLW